jgi:general nucleoside transport system ATP-binding protein
VHGVPDELPGHDRMPLGALAAEPAGRVVEMDRVGRRFGDLWAVREAEVRFEPGEIHAVIGENGAGKSTLLKLAAGVLEPSEGAVRVDGRPLSPATPAEAIRRGIGMVHQHFMLVGAFRAIENVLLGAETVTAGGRLDEAGAVARARALMESAHLSVPLGAVTDTLTVGERQRLEILRVLYRGARALLLDEPTAVLSPLEVGELYATLRRLAGAGCAVAVVTHRLDEVVRFADRVTVMRHGRVVLSRGRGPSEDELTRAIMGGEVPPAFSPPRLDEGAASALEVTGLELTDAAGRRWLDGIELTVRAGEIVGLAGIEGEGQRELVRALAGLEPRARGRVRVGGRDVTSASVRERRAVLGVVHEDRHADGLLLDASVGDNLVFGDLGDPHAAAFDEAATTARRIERFQVDPADPARLASALSGGNQQKLLLARTLDRLPRGPGAVAVLAQPTRGIDVGAAAVIHAAIGDAAAAGLGALVISADLAELRTLSHRIVVLRRGKIVASFPPDASDAAIGRAMLGEEAA